MLQECEAFVHKGNNNYSGIKPPKATICCLNGVPNGSWKRKAVVSLKQPPIFHLLCQTSNNSNKTLKGRNPLPFHAPLKELSDSIFSIEEVGIMINSGRRKRKA